MSDDRFIAIKGRWKGIDGDICLVNVYGPHSREEKSLLWDKLRVLMGNGEDAWCLFGDFNEVRGREDRKNTQINEINVGEFNDFVNEMQLVEIPLGGESLRGSATMVRNLASWIDFWFRRSSMLNGEIWA